MRFSKETSHDSDVDIMPDNVDTALNEHPMPNLSLTVSEFGQRSEYQNGDLLLFSKDRAVELLEHNFTI